MRYQVQENCLTIYLPREVDHHNAVSLIGGEVWAVHTNERILKILTFSGAAKIMQIYEGEK